ncbi:TetR/AcrR family transcriptional regulator [Allonocardiopsis opalescens]|uniref:TetR family transcriptional regulator n=1 Tax=Allonocardiopsis opalescens TaxID=1144618 RepID=A0A2T0Q4R3_9ACTN|nr:TetR/AcrR family transcriptional regulator [Allonocardiopsis opalescens]PRX98792.1 TetR family transcriptional regulator [Allonocardiopsis opalescens]
MPDNASGPAPAVRRQRRGLRRMEEILDAAEAVIAEVGYEEAGTNAIAARAGVSPGSLYQFFRNKGEILDALMPRYIEQSRTFWAEQLGPEAARLPMAEVVDRTLRAAIALKDARPAFWVLSHGSATSPRLAAASAELRAETAARLAAVLAARAPHVPAADLDVAAHIALAAARAVLPMTLGADAGRRDAVIAGLRAMLTGYLESATAGRDE